jgi:hypothetical protein
MFPTFYNWQNTLQFLVWIHIVHVTFLRDRGEVSQPLTTWRHRLLVRFLVICLGTEESHEIWGRAADVPVEIRTQHHSSTSLERYRCANSLGQAWSVAVMHMTATATSGPSWRWWLCNGRPVLCGLESALAFTHAQFPIFACHFVWSTASVV